MVNYICSNCGKIFKQKGHYKNHMNRKTPCKQIDNVYIEKAIIENINLLSDNGDIIIKNKNLINQNTDTIEKMKTGKNRDIIDQFYTNTEISHKCIKQFYNILDINTEDLLVEPSAGDGSFSDYFKEKGINIDTYDIIPKKDYIEKKNFLELDISKYKNTKNKIHTIGNPPFGRQSSLAKKFIKKCCEFSDSISFILPKSFRKETYQSAFPLNFHLVDEIDLGKNAFLIDGKPHNVPCVFQIWLKKQTNRYIEPKQVENGFIFVKKPSLKDVEFDDNGYPIKRENVFNTKPDFGILRAGGGNTCGRISLQYMDGISCYPEAWLFIKLDDKYDKDEFYEKYKKINWIDDSNVGARSISKPVFIKGINELLRLMD